MNSENQENFTEILLEDVVGDRFGRYSKYIIQERALPDARDGLKPVQRRILYAMHEEGNTADKPFRKSAKTVGNVIGNYHPHGDSSVYEAMVRMSQDFKLRNELIEMHGNNGSIDGDPPAAMRYTEARLSAIAGQLLCDIEKKTVDMVGNFDDTTYEPTVLPANFPNLLVNGSTGISSGYATEIPPHNLSEIIAAVIMRLKNPEVTLEELMSVVKGPDFPGGGVIQGIDGIKKAYTTGKGKIIVRGKVAIEEQKGGRARLAITELPYDINKANLVKKIDDIRVEKKIDGIAEVRDESDRSGMLIVVELKKEADAEVMLNFLYKNTDLQVAYNFNMVAINNRRPEQLGLIALLDAYIIHRKEVVRRRCQYDLNKAREREHIVIGLTKALSILDEVIATIRASKDKKDARNNLIKAFSFSELQAEAIVTLQLYRLTNTDITALEKEALELSQTILHLENILNNEKNLILTIVSELKEIDKRFSTPRRSVVEAHISEIKISQKQLIVCEDVIVSVTKEGYIKKSSVRSFNASNGENLGVKEGDRLFKKFAMTTLEQLLLFTNKGNYLICPVYQLPDLRWKDVGSHIGNIVAIDKDEKIVSAIPVNEFSPSFYLTFITKKGIVKRTSLEAFNAQRISRSIVGIKLKAGDQLQNVFMTNGFQYIFIGSKNGYGLIFFEDEIPVTGTKATGVIGISLLKDDEVSGGFSLRSLSDYGFIIVSSRGLVKKMNFSDFSIASRAKRGLLMVRDLKANPHKIIGAFSVDESSQINLKLSTKKDLTVKISDLRFSERQTNGTLLFKPEIDGDVVDLFLT